MRYIRAVKVSCVGGALALLISACTVGAAKDAQPEAQPKPDVPPAVQVEEPENQVFEDPFAGTDWVDDPAFEWQLNGDWQGNIDWYWDDVPYEYWQYDDVDPGDWVFGEGWYGNEEWSHDDHWYLEDDWYLEGNASDWDDWAGQLPDDGDPASYYDPSFGSYDNQGPPIQTVTMLDPVAGAFTIEMPAGWDSTLFSSGTYADARQTAVSVSPDGNTVLFVGDPTAPTYWSPSAAAAMGEEVMAIIDQSETAEWSEYQHATEWTENWVWQKFGALEGFTVLGTDDAPEAAQEALQIMEPQLNVPIDVTAARTHFQYSAEAGPMNGMVTGYTVGMPQGWVVIVRGQSTLGDPWDYEPMVVTMAETLKMTDEWKGQQEQYWQGVQAQSDAFAQQLTDNHNANMDWIRNSSAAHQSKMEGIWAANDASMDSYYDRMASMDSNQRSFLNYIQEENTVQTGDGQIYQVPQGADNYFVNPSTGQSIGGSSAFGESDLLDMGLDPSDWTQTEMYDY